MKLIKFFIISVVSLQSFSTELSIGSIEEIYLKSGTNERRIQIYYPYSKNVNNKTKFIIMNDGEELFSENDSWNGKAWNIDQTFKDLIYHAEVLDLMGYQYETELGKDSVLVIHGGGVYGDKPGAIKRWVENYCKLPQIVRNRLVLENCEKCYSIIDCLKISNLNGVK